MTSHAKSRAKSCESYSKTHANQLKPSCWPNCSCTLHALHAHFPWMTSKYTTQYSHRLWTKTAADEKHAHTAKNGFFSNARSATPATQKTKVMGCPQVHACHAKLKVIRCPQAPRLPRELMVDVAKCHACHAKPTWLPACLPTYLYYLLIIKFISFEGCFTYQILWNPNGIWWVSWGFNCEATPPRMNQNGCGRTWWIPFQNPASVVIMIITSPIPMPFHWWSHALHAHFIHFMHTSRGWPHSTQRNTPIDYEPKRLRTKITRTHET